MSLNEENSHVSYCIFYDITEHENLHPIFNDNLLIDVIDTIVDMLEQNPTSIEQVYELKEAVMIIMENVINYEHDHVRIEYDVEIIIEYIIDHVVDHIEYISDDEDTDEDSCEDTVEDTDEDTDEVDDVDKVEEVAEDVCTFNFIETQINTLRQIPQPVQRTNEWYIFRNNLITASNAHKAFGSQAAQNQLIYEKCQPLKTAEPDDVTKMVNLNTPLHWGQKFEPLSVMIYEGLYNTHVEEFGCIPHPHYNFIGASPDGIVVNNSCDRYGRMLEIKNVVSRVITGIPKFEYWVQMQLQMEVCNLDKCDFLETKFTEYSNETEFYDDVDTKVEEKGIMMLFYRENKPFYLYKPLNITTKCGNDKWVDEHFDLYENSNVRWLRTIYWKLDTISCILVVRDKNWFKESIVQLAKIWRTILDERETGFEHRAPKRRIKQTVLVLDKVTPCVL